jgi:hypothetical protein
MGDLRLSEMQNFEVNVNDLSAAGNRNNENFSEDAVIVILH